LRGGIPAFTALDFDVDAYGEAATHHSTILVFLSIPLMMRCVEWAVHGNVISTSSQIVCGTGVVYFFVAVLCLGSVLTGWTFYAPAVYIIEDIAFVELILVGIILALLVILAELYVYVVDAAPHKSTICSSLFVGAVFGLFILPILVLTILLLILDRFFSTSVLDYPLGSPYIYEVLFWVFGHPEVYFLILPFAGLFVFSRSVNAFAGTSRAGSGLEVADLVSRIAVLSFLVWGHHLFINLTSFLATLFFALASLYIMIPMFDVVLYAFARTGPTRSVGVDVFVLFRYLLYFSATSFFVGGILALGFLGSSTA